jgi:hypothetical protein
MSNHSWNYLIEEPELDEHEAVCPWCNLVFWVPNGVWLTGTDGQPLVVCADCAGEFNV